MSLDIFVFFQLGNAGFDSGHTVPGELSKPLYAVLPIIRKAVHEGQQANFLEGQPLVPEMVIGHMCEIPVALYPDNAQIFHLAFLGAINKGKTMLKACEVFPLP